MLVYRGPTVGSRCRLGREVRLHGPLFSLAGLVTLRYDNVTLV